jgi:uncharacterized RDD family membrane protein YckC
MTYDQKKDLVSIPRRVLGGIIDLVILWLLSLLAGVIYWSGQPQISLLSSAKNTSADLLLGLSVSIFLYVVVMRWTNGSTLGQLAVNARTVPEGGQTIKFSQCFARWLVSIFSSVVLWLGYVSALFNKKRQTLHDVAVSTIVVNRDAQIAEDNQELHGEAYDSGRSTPTLATDAVSSRPVTDVDRRTQMPSMEPQGRVSDDEAFEAAIDEFESGKIERGLYAKIFSEVDGDERKAKAQYLRERVPALKIEIGKNLAELENNRFKNLSSSDKNQYILDLLGSYERENDIPEGCIIEITDELLAKKVASYYVLQSTSWEDELDGDVVFPLPEYTSIRCLKESKYKSTYVNDRLSFLLSNGRIAFLSNSNYLTYDAGGVPDPVIDFDKAEAVEIIDPKSYRLLS